MIPLAIIFSLITVETPQIAICIGKECKTAFFAEPPNGRDYVLVWLEREPEIFERTKP